MADIIMAGFGGQGVLTAGKILIDVAAHEGKNVSWTSSYGAEMRGQPLDGESLKVIPFDMLRDLQSILCYDYEDGKPWHDLAG